MAAFIRVLFWASAILSILSLSKADSSSDDDKSVFTIEGKVVLPQKLSEGRKNWREHVEILVDGGRYKGFLRRDGHFSVTGVPSGSYVVEANHPGILFEPCRVDVTPRGKFRARRLNHLQPKAVEKLDYPLNLRGVMEFKYFQKREELKITDMLFSPMVLMMVLPMVLLFVMPKLLNAADPEATKEMQGTLNMLTNPKAGANMDIASWLSGYSEPAAGSADSKKGGKRKPGKS